MMARVQDAALVLSGSRALSGLPSVLDVNADGLSDLVVAEPRSQSDGARSCKDGHRVYLNRGYGFQDMPGQSVPGEAWSSRGVEGSALDLLYNRDHPCRGGLTVLDCIESTRALCPMSTMATTCVAM